MDVGRRRGGPRAVNLPPRNFLGLEGDCAEREKALAAVLPVPYEATTTFGAGTRLGPRAILDASLEVELFDRELGFEPASRWGVWTHPGLEPDRSSPEAVVNAVEAEAEELLREGKLLCLLGGEHTVSIGIARAAAKVFQEPVVLQLDAHCDLRDSYQGTPFSHACTARRMMDACELVQAGQRSLSEEEQSFRRRKAVATFFAGEEWRPEDVAESVRGRDVFFDVDLDCLDPSEMPAVGTPEPGGLSYGEVVELARLVSRRARVIAVSAVELAPVPGPFFPQFTAARLCYKMLSLALASRQES